MSTTKKSKPLTAKAAEQCQSAKVPANIAKSPAPLTEADVKRIVEGEIGEYEVDISGDGIVKGLQKGISELTKRIEALEPTVQPRFDALKS